MRPLELRRSYSGPQHPLAPSAGIAERVEEAHDARPAVVRLAFTLNFFPVSVVLLTEPALARSQKCLTPSISLVPDVPADRGAASSEEEWEEPWGEQQQREQRGEQKGGHSYRDEGLAEVVSGMVICV